jgi:hypothetical protein
MTVPIGFPPKYAVFVPPPTAASKVGPWNSVGGDTLTDTRRNEIVADYQRSTRINKE